VVDRLTGPSANGAVRAFDRLAGSLDYPMFVVTTAATDDGERSGCLVGFSTQCSIHPPRYLVCLSEKNHTAGVARRASHLALHLVPRQRYDIAALFGEETGEEIDKFEHVVWSEGPGGAPLLDECPIRFVGRIHDRVGSLGDHIGYVLDPVLAEGVSADDYLRFVDMGDMEPGHEA
jgi:flavin reductase (DIM6/NTAB) family NADH-FMN oxidoreductase RutF